MSLWNWLRPKRNEPEQKNTPSHHLAFVLLSETRLPLPGDILSHFEAFAAPGESLHHDVAEAKADGPDSVLSFHLDAGERCFVALMPAPVPRGEADRAAEFSLSSFRNGWKLPGHQAHLLVTLAVAPGDTPHSSLSRFTTVLAAVTAASPAVGVYWGNAGATHDAEFFLSIAREQGIVPRLMLWNGVSVARERDGRLSLLSLGMSQLALPNLLLVSGPDSQAAAMETMFDLLAYVAQRGAAIREGETVGRTDEERLPVRYVTSPVDAEARVWHVELP
jgi:hypothetical protein